MQDKTSSHTPIPTELNIAPRGKSWLHGQIIDGEHGHPTRQSMESAESAQPIKAPAAVAVPDAVRDAEKLLRAEAARLERIYSGHGNNWYGFSDEKAAHIEHLRVADAFAATSAAAPAAVAGSAPCTFMTEDRAREWAWDKVREEVGTNGWTAGDSSNFYGFYLWGWNYRAQYELQRTATRSAVMQEILSAAPAAAAPVVLPEPVAYSLGLAKYAHSSNIIAANEFTPDAEHADEWENLYTEQQVRALLAQKIAIMPNGESAAAQLRAMATNYPTGHSWDKLDAKACIRGALEIEALRALQATATGLPAQAVEPHPDDVAVDSLAALMKAKLAKQRDKGYGGWDTDCTRERLSELLRAHVEKGDPVDVANFCAFLSARGEGIAPQAQADARDDSALLDAMELQRIAVVPEYEGPWDAEIYNDEGQPNHHGTGSTPREAIRAAIAAQTAAQGEHQ